MARLSQWGYLQGSGTGRPSTLVRPGQEAGCRTTVGAVWAGTDPAVSGAPGAAVQSDKLMEGNPPPGLCSFGKLPVTPQALPPAWGLAWHPAPGSLPSTTGLTSTEVTAQGPSGH